MKSIKTKLVLIILLLATVVQIGNQPVIAENASNTLNVPAYRQEKSEWCWVATARMAGRYFYNTSRTQSDGVKYVKGRIVNEGGTLGEIEIAAEYFTHNKENFNVTGVLSFSTIRNYIDRGWPIIAGISWNTGGGHAVVINGYLVNPKNPGGIRYIDPWDATKHYTRYTYFLDGSYNGGKYFGSVY